MQHKPEGDCGPLQRLKDNAVYAAISHEEKNYDLRVFHCNDLLKYLNFKKIQKQKISLKQFNPGTILVFCSISVGVTVLSNFSLLPFIKWDFNKLKKDMVEITQDLKEEGKRLWDFNDLKKDMVEITQDLKEERKRLWVFNDKLEKTTQDLNKRTIASECAEDKDFSEVKLFLKK